jgi:hypothetical protein
MQQELNPVSKAPFAGVAILFASILPVGIVIGGIASVVSNFFYLIILFPILMGLGMSMVIKPIVVSQKIRSPLLVIIAGLFATLVVYSSLHFFDYLQFRNNLAKEIQAEVMAENGEYAPNEEVQAYIDYLLSEETGMPGFIGYVLLEAKQGVSISHVGVGSSDSGINLGVFTWLYWLVEMGFIFWTSIESSYKKARDLFCEHCNAWVPDGSHIGGVQIDNAKPIFELLNQRNFSGAVSMLRKNTSLPSIEFYTRTCNTCSTFPFYLSGYALSSGSKGQTQSKLLLVQTLNATERFALISELKQPNVSV